MVLHQANTEEFTVQSVAWPLQLQGTDIVLVTMTIQLGAPRVVKSQHHHDLSQLGGNGP